MQSKIKTALKGSICIPHLRFCLQKQDSPRITVALNHPSAFGEVPFKRLLWWKFFFFFFFQSLVSRKWKDGHDVWEEGKRSDNAAFHFVSALTSWASVMQTPVWRCFRRVIVIWLLMNTELYNSVYNPNVAVTFEAPFSPIFDEFLLAYYSAVTLLAGQIDLLIFTGCGLFGLISLIPIDSFRTGRLSECVYFDQWV